MQIHVDPLGGWSGDMFVAAMLDAFPDLWPDVQIAIEALHLGEGAACRLVPHRDAALTGRRFVVAAEASNHDDAHDHHHAHDEHHAHGDHHHVGHDHDHNDDHPHGAHRAWSSIRTHLATSDLAASVKDRAIAIFTLLAEAEGSVHGVEPDGVTFHEVGAVDSIVDIVAAAVLIDRVGASRWTSAPLPLGSGRVRTAHGILPVPAPATALLLRGLPTIDDGISGERVTPTGAAVARHLLLTVSDDGMVAGAARRLRATGTGFGTRTMPGISNCLRILSFDDIRTAETPARYAHRELAVITFEVDDQTAEDLTQGLDHIRAAAGVHDVVQSVAFGKKGRMATHVQILVAPDELDGAIVACFEETTTIGLRYHIVQGAALARGFDQVDIEGQHLRVKMVTRPSGAVTGKTEAADVAGQRGHANRARLRRDGETAALSRGGPATGEGA